MRRLICCFCFSLILALPMRSTGEELTAARLLPESVVVYVETTSAGDLLEDLLDHPQRQKWEALPQVQEWLESEDRQRLMLGVRFLELQLGLSWQRAIDKLGGGGVYFALDGASRSVAIMVKSADDAFLKKAHDTLLNLARSDALGKGNRDPFKSTEYRGVQVLRADKVRIAVARQWLILTTSDALGRSIIDHLNGDSRRSLARNAQFRAARASRQSASLAWAYADLATLRSAGVAPQLLGGMSRDPGAELLAGGVLNTLHRAPYATAQLTSAASSIDLALRLPHDPAWTPKPREFFFGPEHHGVAPPEIALPDTILEVRAYRGVSGMWLNGPDLFNDEINARLAKANSDLSTLFGGRPFAEEILGALAGELCFVVVREPSSGQKSLPGTMQLPGFAAIARLQDSAGAQRPLRIAFQTAVGFANLTAAQQGRPPLELETERRDGKTILTADYRPDDDYADDSAAGAEAMAMAAEGTGWLLSLSPTVGFVGDSVVLASTRSLANRLLDELSNGLSTGGDDSQPTDVGGTTANSALRLQLAPLQITLAENRDRLIANNMLEKGHSRAAASREVDGLLTLLECFEQAAATLRIEGDHLQLAVRLTSVEE